MSNKYNLKHIMFYTVWNYFVNMNHQVFYNSPLSEIPSCPPGIQMNMLFPYLNTSYTISSKSYPTASINHPVPPKLPVSKYFIPASFTPAKVLGALYSIPQAQAKSNQLIEEDMNNCKRSLISKCLKLGTPAHTSGPQEQFPPTSTFKIMIYFGLCNFLSITTKLFAIFTFLAVFLSAFAWAINNSIFTCCYLETGL